jgi:hypothetical protein
LKDAWKVDPDYARALDGLARFFNSQITVHTGYLLTSFGVIIALFALLNQWIFLGIENKTVAYVVSSMIIAAVLILYFGARLPYPVCFQYLLGRIQYYQCLSEVAWDHMGVTKTNTTLVNALEERARMLGIMPAVLTRFEFILYYTLRKRQNNPRYEKAAKLYHMENARYEGRGYEQLVLGFWDLPKLLLLACTRLRQYKSSDQLSDQKIAELWVPWVH